MSMKVLRIMVDTQGDLRLRVSGKYFTECELSSYKCSKSGTNVEILMLQFAQCEREIFDMDYREDLIDAWKKKMNKEKSA